MTAERFDALCRAWHRKTRRPVPAVNVGVDDAFFTPPADDADPTGQKTLAAVIPR